MRHTKPFTAAPRFFALLVSLVIFGTSVPTLAAAETTYSIDIPAQDLGAALKALGAAADQQVLFSDKVVAGLKSRTLTGEFTAGDALKQLLAGTGLEADQTPNGVYLIRPLKDARSETSSGSAPAGGAARGGAEGLRVVQTDQSNSLASGEADKNDSAQKSDAAFEESNPKLEEIIVTAQKREERLQDVPISISVLSGADLDRSTVEGVTEALRRVPGVGINETYQGGGTQVAVRGVTAGGALFNGSSPISYYLDSVPFGMVRQAIGPDLNAFDLDRVEVLRGPQGTLYGASAQNGVVRVLTKDADANKLEVKARTSGSSTREGGESYRGDLAVNVPIVDGKLAVRAVAGYQDVAGWIDRPNKKDANDAEIRNMRLKINAQPTEALSIGLSAWASRADYGMPSIANDNGRHASLRNEPVTTDFDAYGLKIDYELTRVVLTSMTSYLDYLNDGYVDLQAIAPNNLTETRLDANVFAQEVVLNSAHEDAWKWSLGGMFRDAEDRQFQKNILSLTGFALDQTYASESVAIFGELTRRFLEGTFELTGGLRYFEDRVRGREDGRLNGTTPLGEQGRQDFDALSPRVVLTWHPGDNGTIYASYAEGFRSGFGQSGSLLGSAPQFPPVDADTLHNYELGAKASFWSNRIDFDAAVYFIDWKDVQQSLTVPIPGIVGGIATGLINGKSASGLGFDFAVTARPAQGLGLGVSFSWNDLAMDSDVFSFVSPTTPVLLFAAGDRLNISPELTAGAFADYDFAFGGGGLQGKLSVSGNYTSEMDLRTIAAGAQRIADGDSMLIARASFAVASPGGWTATIFADNIGNEQGSPVRQPFNAAVTDLNAQVRPRTIGVQLEYRFNNR